MLKDFNMLGLQGKDIVSGFEGVVTCVSYDLYGCIQVIITPGVDKDGKPQDGRWFDTKRIKILSSTPVMEIPDFSAQATVIGAAEKPAGRL